VNARLQRALKAAARERRFGRVPKAGLYCGWPPGPTARIATTRMTNLTDTWINPRFAAIFGDTLHDF
jgi:hypothetical protein